MKNRGFPFSQVTSRLSEHSEGGVLIKYTITLQIEQNGKHTSNCKDNIIIL